MKKLLLVLPLMLSLFCCDKDNDNNQIILPVSQLPPATQVGANTAGCLVNGEAFLPKGTGIILSCFYQDGLNFGLGFSNKVGNIDRIINIASLNEELIEGESYQLKTVEEGSKFGEYSIDSVAPPNPNYYSTTNIVTGELRITHHDFQNAIISGTFWYDAINSNGQRIEIREGRFDMQY